MDNIIVLIIAAALIAFITWWFFGNHATKEISANVDGKVQAVDVVVNGGYSPSTVVLQKGMPARVNFNRKDESSCLEQVVFADLGINQFLPKNETTEIEIDTSKAGEYEYACGMNMFHGKVIVK